MMTDNVEDERLIIDDDECAINIMDGPVTSEANTPLIPSVNKVIVTPSTPINHKVTSDAGCYLGVEETSQGSSRTKLLDIATTPVDIPTGSSKFLYVKEKFRRPSFLTDIGVKPTKNGKVNPKMGSLKKDLNLNLFGEQTLPSVPPNTPSPSGWRNQSALELFECKIENQQTDNSISGSNISSQVTTKAVASESDSNTPKAKTSTETLLKEEKFRSPVPFNGNFDSNYSLTWSENLNFLKSNPSHNIGLRSLGSSIYMKSRLNYKGQKNIQHHCFMSDITDVRQMEHALLQLLEDFHSGKLKAFTKDCSMDQMQGIREQQERLTRLHFDLCSQQDLFTPLSEEGIHANQENMHKLMESLEQLSLSIEKLQLFSKDMAQE